MNDFASKALNLTYINSKNEVIISTNSSDISLYDVDPDTYTIYIGSYYLQANFELGGVYALLAANENATLHVSMVI